MTKNLVIVESPTKSKTIEKFLGRNYTVRASMGHLRDLPKSLFGVDIEHDFEPKYINIRGKGELIKELKTLAKKADKIYLATDPDREGEAIGWHLAHILGVDPEANCRIEFHEITSGAIKDALKNPRPIDLDKVDAQQARRIIDRIVGYQLSPLLWRKIRKGLSAGRVQSVAVKIIADREKEIADFIPKEYWTLNAKLREKAKAPIFEAEVIKHLGKKLEIHTAEEAAIVEKALAKAAYIIEEATKKERKRNPLPPFTTSSLQQEAVKRLNFTTKKTMMVAQQLYEGVAVGKEGSVGLITYMRTDSVRIADVAAADIRSYIESEFGKEFRPSHANSYSSKKNAQDAHEAIRPTSVHRTPLEMAKHLGAKNVYLHCITDGRDTDPHSGKGFLADLQAKLDALGVGKIASVSGRYYAMDRDNNWDREEKAYAAFVYGEGEQYANAAEAIEASYANDKTDEFVLPCVTCEGGRVQDGDTVIFMNFRPDRARQMTRIFCDDAFTGFERRGGRKQVHYVCMAEYDATMPNCEVAYPPVELKNVLGQYLSENGKTQLRIAETEKYAHVTFFFNGGVEAPYEGEDRCVIPSPKVATYDLKPEMSAPEVADECVKRIESGKYDVVILNFANCDMVGHTGVFDAAVKAVEAVDTAVDQVVTAVLKAGGCAFITADHGNAEKMMNPDGTPFTAHTTNVVPFVAVGCGDVKLREGGCLADIAPTMLPYIGLPVPAEMTGKSIIVE